MIRWVLDTNICIAVIKRQPQPVLRRLRGKALGQVGISAITIAELEFWAAKSSRPEQARLALAEFLLPLEILPFDAAAAAEYGTIRTALEIVGRPIGPLDTLIAAHALALDAALVTNNVRELRTVAGLRVEDWLE